MADSTLHPANTLYKDHGLQVTIILSVNNGIICVHCINAGLPKRVPKIPCSRCTLLAKQCLIQCHSFEDIAVYIDVKFTYKVVVAAAS